ncbi:MAG TPA: hypothetical protein VFT46_11520 [Holophagaceae bacterium]|nr:hypothetical protein [Holophagaceae bacterium]
MAWTPLLPRLCLALALGLPPGLPASVPGHLAWRDGQLYRVDRGHLDLLVPGAVRKAPTPAPEGAIWTAVGPDGALWALGAPRAGAAGPPHGPVSEPAAGAAANGPVPRIQPVWRREPEAETWSRWADYRLSGDDALSALVPLDGDRVFALSRGVLWEGGGSLRNETQGVFRRQGEDLVLDHLVSLDLVGDPFLPWRGDPKAAPKGTVRAGRLLAFNRLHHLWTESFLDFAHPDALPPLWQAGETACVVNRSFGLIWVFDGLGALARRIALFDLGPDETLAQPGAPSRYARAVLGCEPTADGRLLVATRSLDAIVGERVVYPLQERGRPVPPARYTGNTHWGRLQFPEIWWWRVDPTTGKAERIAAPPGAPLFLDDRIVQQGLDWTCTPQGDPVFPPSKAEAPEGP